MVRRVREWLVWVCRSEEEKAESRKITCVDRENRQRPMSDDSRHVMCAEARGTTKKSDYDNPVKCKCQVTRVRSCARRPVEPLRNTTCARARQLSSAAVEIHPMPSTRAR
jgi:hypothetical protein